MCAVVSAKATEITREVLNLRLDHKREAEAAEESVSRSTRNSSSDGPLSESVHQDAVTGNPPICEAVERGDLHAVKKLIKNNCDVNAKDNQGNAALHLAVIHGHLDILSELLRVSSCDVNLPGSGWPPIHQGVESTRPQILKTVNSCECSSKSGGYKFHVNRVCQGSMSTALHLAVTCGNLHAARALVNFGCDVNRVDIFGNRPLFTAAYQSDTELIRLLLEGKADPNKLCTRTEKLPTKNYEWTFSPLHICIEKGNLEAVQALVEAGADVNCKYKHGKTPLMQALIHNQPRVVQYLLNVAQEKHLDLSIADRDGHTALFSTCMCDNAAEFTLRLIELGCDVNHQSSSGETPLCVAVEMGCPTVTLALLYNGADPNVLFQGTSLLCQVTDSDSDCRADSDGRGVAAQLIYFGADVNATGSVTCPLLWALKHGYYEMADLLMCGCEDRRACVASPLGTTFPGPALSVLCRNAIRTHLRKGGTPLPRQISQLPLPKKLLRFVRLDDILGDVLRKSSEPELGSDGTYHHAPCFELLRQNFLNSIANAR